MPRSVEAAGSVQLIKNNASGASLSVPLNLSFADNVDLSELKVKVSIDYDANQIASFEVGEVTQAATPKKRGFLARLFGG